jgi:hypothetical protein
LNFLKTFFRTFFDFFWTFFELFKKLFFELFGHQFWTSILETNLGHQFGTNTISNTIINTIFLLQDEGYVDLAHIKELKMTSNIDSFPEDIRVSAQKHFQGVIEPKAIRLVYGSTLAENRILTFICPPGVASQWKDTLDELINSIKAEDPRMVWLKDQYLFLYYQDDLCMGPLAADAIKVKPSCHN